MKEPRRGRRIPFRFQVRMRLYQRQRPQCTRRLASRERNHPKRTNHPRDVLLRPTIA